MPHPAQRLLISADEYLTDEQRAAEKGDSCGLEMPRTLVGGNPTWVIASHEPSIESCCGSGNRRLDA